MSRLLGIPFFFMPILSGLVWLGMLLGMLLWWVVKEHSQRLPAMDSSQHIAFVTSPPIGAKFLTKAIVTYLTLARLLYNLYLSLWAQFLWRYLMLLLLQSAGFDILKYSPQTLQTGRKFCLFLPLYLQ
jgi:hypothetical protein